MSQHQLGSIAASMKFNRQLRLIAFQFAELAACAVDFPVKGADNPLGRFDLQVCSGGGKEFAIGPSLLDAKSAANAQVGPRRLSSHAFSQFQPFLDVNRIGPRPHTSSRGALSSRLMTSRWLVASVVRSLFAFMFFGGGLQSF